jgi:phosphonate transport system substrate-binding protein
MGVFPRRNIKHTYSAFTPMARYLESVLGRSVQLVAVREFSEFWRHVRHRRFDLVHFNQYHYLVSHKLYGYSVILKNQEFGQDEFASALFVRSDSGLEKVTDLRDKNILFGGGKRAMLSYIVPTWLLRQAGLSDGDYMESIALNPPNAVISTYHGRADAAGAGESITQLDIVRKNINVNSIIPLVRSEKISHLPWAVRDDMKPEMRQLIQSALVNLVADETGQSILKSAKLTAMTIADDAQYQSSDRIITELYGKNYAQDEA